MSGAKMEIPEKMKILVAALAALFFGLLSALFFIVPLGNFSRKLLGTSQWAPDNILNAGLLEWGYKAFSTHKPVFNWLAGWPVSNSLAGGENLLGWQVFYTPLRVFGVGTVAATNGLMFLSFVVAALGAVAFAKHYGLRNPAAFCAGLAFAFCPAKEGNIIQLQSMAVCWVPWALFYLERFRTSGKYSDASLSIIIICLTMLSGMYIGIFLFLTIAIMILVRWNWQGVYRSIVVAATSLLLLSPVLWHYLDFNRRYGLVKDVGYMETHSVGLASLFQPSDISALWGSIGSSKSTPFLGFTFLALIFFGLWKGGLPRKDELQISIVAGVLTLLACGPALILNVAPVTVLGHYIPMPGRLFAFLPGIRVPSRILMLAMLFASVLAGAGFSAVVARFGKKAGLIAALCLLAESYPAPWLAANSVFLSEPMAMADAYRNLRGCTAIVELPMDDAQDASRDVYAAAGDLTPTVSYYGSMMLKEPSRLQDAAERLPNESAKSELVQSGVNCLVVHQFDGYEPLLERLTAAYSTKYVGKDSTIFNLN